MDRKKFQKIFLDIDEFLIASLCDDIELCEKIDYPVYTNCFFPPQPCKRLVNINLGNLLFKTCGLNENCEKNMIGIVPEDFSGYLEFPVKYFKITNRSKFKQLEHKDYLGTLMGLGIKRELLGDLIVKNDMCYGIAGEEIYDFIVKNMKCVGKNPVDIEEILPSEVPETEYEDMMVTVASSRFDNIVSAVSNFSRTKGIQLIENGEVFLNYAIEKSKSAEVKEGDIITIRKNGKYLVGKELGESKKGKTRISVRKFV